MDSHISSATGATEVALWLIGKVCNAVLFRADPEQVIAWLLDRLAWLVTEPSELRQGIFDEEYERITDPYQKLYGAASLGREAEFLATMRETNDENSRIELISQLSPLKNTFLHIAVSYGHETLAMEIVNLHRPLLFEKNIQGDTALHIAAKGGRRGMVGSLLRLIAETCHSSITSDGEGFGDVENPMSLFGMLGMKNEEGNTALHEALINGHEGVAHLLINTDPSLSFTANNQQKSSLYLATEAKFRSTVKLISGTADQNSTNSIGKSPMHIAILHRDKEMIHALSSMGFTIKLRDEEGRTPLHYAASIGYFEGVCFFLHKCSSESHYCNQPDNTGTLPIHSASTKGHVYIVRVLLQHFPALKEAMNSDGQNLLHVAAESGKHNLVRYFLKEWDEFQLLINHRDKHGNTPLHLATIHKHARVVKYLTWDRRTDLNLSNKEDMTALDIAESTKEVIGSFRGRLTWVALKSAGAKRAKHLHVRLRTRQSPAVHVLRVTDGQVAPENEDAAEVIKACRPDTVENLRLHDKESYKDSVNTLLLMTTLVATVTFAAGFTMPGGYNDSDPFEGRATLLKRSMFQVFVISDTIAMYSSLFVAVTLIWAQSGDLIMVFTALRLVMPVLGMALAMLSLAFMAGVYVVLSNLPWLAYLVLVIGIIFLYTVLVLFTPFFLPETRPTYPHVTYYPFYLVALLASGSQWDDLDEG